MDELEKRLLIMEQQIHHLTDYVDEVDAKSDRHIHRVSEECRNLDVRTRGLERYLWMGLGGLAVLMVALKFIKI